MDWNALGTVPFIGMAHRLQNGDGDEEPVRREHTRAAYWLLGVMTAVATYFAVQFTSQLRADVTDLQRARTAQEIDKASWAAEREGIRSQLRVIQETLNRLDAKVERYTDGRSVR